MPRGAQGCSYFAQKPLSVLCSVSVARVPKAWHEQVLGRQCANAYYRTVGPLPASTVKPGCAFGLSALRRCLHTC